MAALAARLVRPDPTDSAVKLASFREAVEHPRFACVFTAHPTFSLPREVSQALAELASGGEAADFASHRPQGVTLGEEFGQAVDCIQPGRDALDRLAEALLAA